MAKRKNDPPPPFFSPTEKEMVEALAQKYLPFRISFEWGADRSVMVTLSGFGDSRSWFAHHYNPGEFNDFNLFIHTIESDMKHKMKRILGNLLGIDFS